MPYVAFYHLIHQTVDRTTGSGDQLQQVRTFSFIVECYFNGLHLASYAAHPGHQLLL